MLLDVVYCLVRVNCLHRVTGQVIRVTEALQIVQGVLTNDKICVDVRKLILNHCRKATVKRCETRLQGYRTVDKLFINC